MPSSIQILCSLTQHAQRIQNPQGCYQPRAEYQRQIELVGRNNSDRVTTNDRASGVRRRDGDGLRTRCAPRKGHRVARVNRVVQGGESACHRLLPRGLPDEGDGLGGGDRANGGGKGITRPGDARCRTADDHLSLDMLVQEHSRDADLLMVGYSLELLDHSGEQVFQRHSGTNDTLFVNANQEAVIS